MRYSANEKIELNEHAERLTRWLTRGKIGRSNIEIQDKFGWTREEVRALREFINTERADLQMMSDVDGKGYRICRTAEDLFNKLDHSIRSANGMTENELEFVKVFRTLNPMEWSAELERAMDCLKMYHWAYTRYQEEQKSTGQRAA